MFVIPANERSIGTALTLTQRYTHQGLREAGHRVRCINSHRPGKPPIGVRTVKLLPDNGPRSHLRETEI